jgi:hypothetical protein
MKINDYIAWFSFFIIVSLIGSCTYTLSKYDYKYNITCKKPKCVKYNESNYLCDSNDIDH